MHGALGLISRPLIDTKGPHVSVVSTHSIRAEDSSIRGPMASCRQRLIHPIIHTQGQADPSGLGLCVISSGITRTMNDITSCQAVNCFVFTHFTVDDCISTDDCIFTL